MKFKHSKSIILVLVCAATIFCFTACGHEKEQAIEAYKNEVERINSEVNELTSLIDGCEKVIKEKEQYETELKNKLETAITDTRASITEIPECPGKTEEINALVNDTLKKVSYLSAISSLRKAKKDYEDVVAILQRVTNPSETFIISCLEKVNGITGYSAATEDNDPNGHLNKPGGYTSQVYFTYKLVNQNEVSGNTIIEKGTDGGGSIEVYETQDLAEKRNEYLSTFDGTIFSGGSHTVVGTIVVRTSDNLTATQQKELETAIIKELTSF